MFGASTPQQIARRFGAVAQAYIADGPAERADRAKRKLLQAIADQEPATLNEVARAVGRGAPAVSRSVDSVVRAGLVVREPDPQNRRRLAMRLSETGSRMLAQPLESGGPLTKRLERLAPSELRAVERAIEILERRTP